MGPATVPRPPISANIATWIDSSSEKAELGSTNAGLRPAGHVQHRPLADPDRTVVQLAIRGLDRLGDIDVAQAQLPDVDLAARGRQPAQHRDLAGAAQLDGLAAEARPAQCPGGRCEAAFFLGARNASGKKAARLNRGRAGTGAHNTAS
ncbi:hypothetical protein [Lactiplantibacillus plantarum]|uniref:hypothetical protein n=1 Tax=Lactiplantibacillus plantarum TaxID=1590 RepID=UPI00404554C2